MVNLDIYTPPSITHNLPRGWLPVSYTHKPVVAAGGPRLFASQAARLDTQFIKRKTFASPRCLVRRSAPVPALGGCILPFSFCVVISAQGDHQTYSSDVNLSNLLVVLSCPVLCVDLPPSRLSGGVCRDPLSAGFTPHRATKCTVMS